MPSRLRPWISAKSSTTRSVPTWTRWALRTRTPRPMRGIPRADPSRGRSRAPRTAIGATFAASWALTICHRSLPASRSLERCSWTILVTIPMTARWFPSGHVKAQMLRRALRSTVPVCAHRRSTSSSRRTPRVQYPGDEPASLGSPREFKTSRRSRLTRRAGVRGHSTPHGRAGSKDAHRPIGPPNAGSEGSYRTPVAYPSRGRCPSRPTPEYRLAA